MDGWVNVEQRKRITINHIRDGGAKGKRRYSRKLRDERRETEKANQQNGTRRKFDADDEMMR